ncbi:hypothetical protein [Saccharopolyspora sp. ASAGF58]|uniref:hypothetical protein n=1 Tax=Saccharopolyspora sp. ASAGF58 TaxID=2719023 RepID=UPI001440168F|nr:hypothetical protein [Saccharopolyspora sp. ASAGF58]QIZ36151.1 hypothetical protein FDZ84_17530 [Saccharopolyspora sp. ASAGF58]
MANEGALVVVLLPDPDHLLWPEFSRLQVPMTRPSGKAVLSECLKVEHVEFAEQDLDRASLKAHLEDASSRSAALITNSGVRRQLAAGWRVVAMRGVDGWLEKFKEWLVASNSGASGRHLLNVLVEPTHGELAKFGMLHVASRDWAAAGADSEERAARQRICRELARKIDAAQGLRLTDLKGT